MYGIMGDPHYNKNFEIDYIKNTPVEYKEVS